MLFLSMKVVEKVRVKWSRVAVKIRMKVCMPQLFFEIAHSRGGLQKSSLQVSSSVLATGTLVVTK